MKKPLGIVLGTISALIISSPVFAAPINACPQSGGFNVLCFERDFGGNVIGKGVQLIMVIAVLVALAYLIWGGVKWVMSEGDKTQVEAARNHIVAAIIGLVIVFLVFFILNVVVGFFIPGFKFTNIELPSL